MSPEVVSISSLRAVVVACCSVESFVAQERETVAIETEVFQTLRAREEKAPLLSDGRDLSMEPSSRQRSCCSCSGILVK